MDEACPNGTYRGEHRPNMFKQWLQMMKRQHVILSAGTEYSSLPYDKCSILYSKYWSLQLLVVSCSILKIQIQFQIIVGQNVLGVLQVKKL